MKKIITIVLIFSHCISLYAQNNGDRLFDNSFLHVIHFENSNISNLWDSLSSYTLAKMTIDGQVVDSLGLRFKGQTSSMSSQKKLKVDLNRYISGQKFDGLKQFNLHNHFQDNFFQRNVIAYEMYRRAGLPAPRTSYAEVYVSGVFKGIYIITEQIDKTFLKHNYPSSNGSLYKGIYGLIGGSVILKEGTNVEWMDYSSNVNASNIGQYVHLRNYLKQLAIDMIIEDGDALAFDRHNYYLYYETKSQKLNYITWDHDYAFPIPSNNSSLYPIGTHPASTNLINDPTIRTMYNDIVCEFTTYLLDSAFISTFATHNYNIINTNSNSILADDPMPLIQSIQNRKLWIENELNNNGITCGSLTLPISPNDIAINEFVAWSDSAGGVQEPNGGTPDWIELYNNTNSDITLDKHYYLSDDKDFPKKWYFPVPRVIPANGYLIVWADKDVHQQDIHAGFKIEKDGGDVLLTYENGTVLQQINYGAQSLNQGHARVPNGVGSFIIQQHTFNANNNNVSSIDNYDLNETILLYPNPTDGYVYLESQTNINLIRITNSEGKNILTIKNPKSPIRLDFLVSGLYFLEAHTDDGRHGIKLIKK